MNKPLIIKKINNNAVFNYRLDNKTDFSLCESGLIRVFGYMPDAITVYFKNPKKKQAKKARFNRLIGLNIQCEYYTLYQSAGCIAYDMLNDTDFWVVAK